MVLLLGLEDLSSLRNIERVKRDLRVSHIWLEVLIRQASTFLVSSFRPCFPWLICCWRMQCNRQPGDRILAIWLDAPTVWLFQRLPWSRCEPSIQPANVTKFIILACLFAGLSWRICWDGGLDLWLCYVPRWRCDRHQKLVLPSPRWNHALVSLLAGNRLF